MRRVMGDEPGHEKALGQVCCAGRDGLGSTSSLETLSAGQNDPRAGWAEFFVVVVDLPSKVFVVVVIMNNIKEH